MNCERCRSRLTLFALGDLAAADAKEIQSHLDSCGECSNEFPGIELTVELLQESLGSFHEAPVHLSSENWKRIMDADKGIAGRSMAWVTQWHPGLAVAAGLMLVAGISWLLVSGMRFQRSDAPQYTPASESIREYGVEIVPAQPSDKDTSPAVVTGSAEGSMQRFEQNTAETASLSNLRTVNGRAAGDERYESVSKIGINETIESPEPLEPGPPAPIELPASPEEIDKVGLDLLADSLKGEKLWDYDGDDSGSYNRGLPGLTRRADLEEAHRVRRAISKSRANDAEKLEEDERARSTVPAKKMPVAEADQIVQEVAADAPHDSLRRLVEELPVQLVAEDIEPQHAQVASGPIPEPADTPVPDISIADAKRKREKEEDDGYARFGDLVVNPFYSVTERAASTFSIDVDTASYTVARNYLNRGVLPPRAAVRTEEFVNFFDYGYEAPRKETFRVYSECAPSKFGRGLHLLKVGVKGRRLGREEQRGVVLTLLVDTSGSMEQPDRMGLVRKSVKMLVESLGAEDLVALIQYDSHARVVLEYTKAGDRKKILEAMDGLQCGGSTNLEEGMSRAYALAAGSFKGGAENRVLLLSDGVANLGAVAAEDILGKVAQYRKQGITCSVFGFGMGTYDDKMLEALADKGNGAYSFIDSEGEARRLLVDDLGATLHTIASDVKIQVEFNPKRVKRYRQLGYENRQLHREDFRNDMVDAGEVGSGQSVTALYEIELMDGNTLDRADQLATVRVRYRRIDTGDVEETRHVMTAASVSSRFDDMPAPYRLAAGVSEFSEILRGSTHSAGSELEQVAGVLRPVAMELNIDGRVQELLRLVESAKGMSRAVQ